MNKEYRAFYDQLAYTREQKQQIAALAAEKAGRDRQKGRRGLLYLGKLAAAAACLVTVLTVSAEAAGIPTPLSELVGPFFGGSIAQCQIIDSIGYPVDASDTDNGITVRAEAILGDQYNAAFVFSFTRENGQPILPEGMDVRALNLGGFGDVDLQRMGGSHGFARFVDTVPGDDVIHYIYYVSSDYPLNRGTAKVKFENLYANQESKEVSEPVLEGTWQFRFEIDYEDSARNLGGGETFRQEGLDFTITEVLLSPIAVQVSYEVDSQVQWSNAPSGRLPEEDRQQMERYMERVTLLLTKKDGTVIDLTYGAGGGIRPENGKTYCTKGTVLEEIIPLEELQSITVGPIEYPIH